MYAGAKALDAPYPLFWVCFVGFWHRVHAKILHVKTNKRPAKNVIKLEHRKAYQ